MIRDGTVEKKVIFLLSFYIHNQKQAARFNKSVISNADRKSLEREKNKKEKKTKDNKLLMMCEYE
jgi:hypothetical protein